MCGSRNRGATGKGGKTGKGKTKRGRAKGAESSRSRGPASEGPPGKRVRSQQAIEKRILRGFARRAERALSRGEEEAAAGRAAQEAPEVEDVTVEDALRLQSRPQEGRHLGYGEWLEEDVWVPEELPSVEENATWNRLRRQYPGLSAIAAENPGRSARESYLRSVASRRVQAGLVRLARTSRRTTSGSSSGAEAGESEDDTFEARQTSRVIPPTEWSWTEPAVTVDGDNATHAPTTVFTSSSEEEEKPKEEPGESSSVDFESRASSVGWRGQRGAVSGAASSSSRGPEQPPGEWQDRTEQGQQQRSWWQASQQGAEANRLWAEWYRVQGGGGWQQQQGGGWYHPGGTGWHR